MPNPFAGCGTLFLLGIALLVGFLLLSAFVSFWSSLDTSGAVAFVMLVVVALVVVVIVRRRRRQAREQLAAEQVQIQQLQAFRAEEQRQQEARERQAWEEQQRVARWHALCSNFGEQAATRIAAGKIWVGQRAEMLTASLGTCGAVKQRVLKTKTKETWSYWPDERGRYRLKVTLENGIVVGWETAEGTSAPAAEPM